MNRAPDWLKQVERDLAAASHSASALLLTEQNFRKIMGYRDLCMLKAAMHQKEVTVQQAMAPDEPDRRLPLTTRETPSRNGGSRTCPSHPIFCMKMLPEP
jgi:hypothetical protein